MGTRQAHCGVCGTPQEQEFVMTTAHRSQQQQANTASFDKVLAGSQTHVRATKET